LENLRICIDARLIGGISGGIQQFVQGLAVGLSKLESESEEYYFLTYRDAQDWITPYLDDRFQIISVPGPFDLSWPESIFLKFPGNWLLLKFLMPFLHHFEMLIPASDGAVERSGIHIMHFTTQNGFLTNIPSIYHPHDLLHLHYPHYLPKWVVIKRDITYRKLCAQAKIIASASSWVKEDIKKYYHVPEEKLAVVPLAPPTETYPNPSAEDLVHVKKKFCLPEHFIFYPAQTWPHKNHIGLLNVLASLRERNGLTIPFVSSGKINDFFGTIQKKIDELNLNGQVQFLDFVNPIEISCLYKLCRFVVIPTKFEAGSFPLWEAFQSGVPAACSNVTSLPSQAGGAALLFDPTNTDEMIDAITQLWFDKALRRNLVLKGHKQVQKYNWVNSAMHFRAIYRKISGRPLTEEDTLLLQKEFKMNYPAASCGVSIKDTNPSLERSKLRGTNPKKD
jgi:glycosyltransferase involved in cell wall biosynthesis